MRLAFFSPLPPQKSGIARYSAELLLHLNRLAEVVLFVDDPAQVDALDDLEIRAIDTFCGPLAERFDMCLYQMGNNIRYHQAIYETLLEYPGVTVLHDPNLYAFHDDLSMQHDNRGILLREMGYGSGLAGVHAGSRILNHTQPRNDQRFPLLEHIGNTSLGVITHSHYAQRYVRRRCPTARVEQINQPRDLRFDSWTAGQAAAAAAKARLGYSADDLLIGSFGYAAPTKRIHVILKVIAALRDQFPSLRYAVVGAVVDAYDVEALAEELGLSELVRFVGYAEDETFADYLAAVDIGVNLRHPTTGETSAALLATMAAGKACLVSNTDAFVELPDSACVKISTDASEQSQLEEWLSRLAQETALRHNIGQEAFDYIRREYAPATAAQRYVDFVESIVDDLGDRKTW